MRDAHAFLDDIVASARLVLQYVEGLTFEQFEANIEKQDSVIHRLEAIGEATKQLPLEIIEAIPEIPWRKISGMRNFLVHQYWAVDLKLVWGVAHEQLEPLITAIEAYRP